MQKVLTRAESPSLYYIENDRRFDGMHSGLRGNCSELYGDCTELRGNCSGLSGDCTGLSGNCSGLRGDCTGLSGDLDAAQLTEAERQAGVDIFTLVVEVLE